MASMLVGVPCAGLVATWAVGKVLDQREGALRDRQEAARITNQMKTVCVGRFLIDMPENAQLDMSQSHIDGFVIQAFDETAEGFTKRVADRETQIRSTPDWLGGNLNLESARDAQSDRGIVGRTFFHGRTVTEGTHGNGLGGVERYRDEGITTEADIHGRGVSIDLFSIGRGLQWVEDLPRLVKQLVVNPENRIPTEPGFCMDRACVRDPLSADQNEQITMFARLPDHPDIGITLVLMAGRKPRPHGILARTRAADRRLTIAERMRITKLRAAPRKIGSLAGEELVERINEENDARVHSFWWEVNGAEDNVLRPHLVLSMPTGNNNRQPVPSSLSDGAALHVWDKIVSSIRLRTVEPRFETADTRARQ
jgi:hypothetical protein